MSADRIYLRISRKMLAFDVCAAPFGNAFFFSWWRRELPASNGLGCLATLFALGGAGWLLRFAMRTRAAAEVPLTLLQVAIVGTLLFLLALWLIGIFIRRGYIFSEDGVLNLPLIGPLYAFLFQPPTFYKLDTIDMYQRAVHAAVLEVVDGTMSAKGLRALSADARIPRLGGPLGS